MLDVARERPDQQTADSSSRACNNNSGDTESTACMMRIQTQTYLCPRIAEAGIYFRLRPCTTNAWYRRRLDRAEANDKTHLSFSDAPLQHHREPATSVEPDGR
jgi:hypothetical protein